MKLRTTSSSEEAISTSPSTKSYINIPLFSMYNWEKKSELRDINSQLKVAIFFYIFLLFLGGNKLPCKTNTSLNNNNNNNNNNNKSITNTHYLSIILTGVIIVTWHNRFSKCNFKRPQTTSTESQVLMSANVLFPDILLLFFSNHACVKIRALPF